MSDVFDIFTGGLASLTNIRKQDEPNRGRVKSCGCLSASLSTLLSASANHSFKAFWSLAKHPVVVLEESSGTHAAEQSSNRTHSASVPQRYLKETE